MSMKGEGEEVENTYIGPRPHGDELLYSGIEK